MPVDSTSSVQQSEFWSTVQKEETTFTRGSQELGKDEFLKLFGFGLEGIDYEADVDTLVEFEPETL